MKKLLILGMALLVGAIPMTAKKPKAPKNVTVSFPTQPSVSNRYGNLDYGLRIQVNCDVSSLINLSELPSKEAAKFPHIKYSLTVQQAAEEYLDNMFSGLGFNIGSDPDTDFILRVRITNFSLRVRDYNEKRRVGSSSAAMVVSWELMNADRDVVIDQTTCTGRSVSNDFYSITSPLNVAFSQTLGRIDSDRIASQLKIAKSARQEKNKSVRGEGNTALEHTVIRWNIVSRPQGADVSWRVISSTPDVQNTNSNYVGNTPYESTESFDIKGLTYNNSGNVQIEVTCERSGYLPQKKRFNLRQAIDQKEISALFNLVKEAEEE